jgi:hypothetical protein
MTLKLEVQFYCCISQIGPNFSHSNLTCHWILSVMQSSAMWHALDGEVLAFSLDHGHDELHAGRCSAPAGQAPSLEVLWVICCRSLGRAAGRVEAWGSWSQGEWVGKEDKPARRWPSPLAMAMTSNPLEGTLDDWRRTYVQFYILSSAPCSHLLFYCIMTFCLPKCIPFRVR